MTFWQLCFNHPFLTFFLACIVFGTIEECVKYISRRGGK